MGTLGVSPSSSCARVVAWQLSPQSFCEGVLPLGRENSCYLLDKILQTIFSVSYVDDYWQLHERVWVRLAPASLNLLNMKSGI